MPKISIIIPVYNVERYLEDCLNSVLKQSMDEIEIICINDGSTDNSIKILNKFAILDYRIHIINQSNAGLAKARNIGIEKAVGKYICFLDSDDMLASGALQRMYDMSEIDKLDVLCFDAKTVIDEEYSNREEDRREYCIRLNEYKGVKTGKEFFVKMIENDEFYNYAWLLFVNRQWIEEKQIYFYPGILYEDILFSLNCYLKSTRMSYQKSENYIYRIRKSSIMTSSVKFKNLYSYIINYKEVYKILLSQNNIKIQRAIVKYINIIIMNIRYIDSFLESSETKYYEFLSPEEQLIADSIGVCTNRISVSKNLYLNGFYNVIKSSNGVILYGAGKVGKKVYQYLSKVGLGNKIKFFSVSEEIKVPNNVFNIPVWSIYNLLEYKHYLILITARKNYQNQMELLLKNLGFVNYELVDYQLERMIDQCLEDNED